MRTDKIKFMPMVTCGTIGIFPLLAVSQCHI